MERMYMGSFRKKIFVAAGYNTLFFGPGRPEFDPKKPMPGLEWYLQDAAQGVLAQMPHSDVDIDEGVIGSFMAAQFLKQGNLPGLLPFMIPNLKGKPCFAVEGACGTGGRAIGVGMRALLADVADSVFVCGFEIQNNMKALYGADLLAGAAYYAKERKSGHAFFFPGLFSDRAAAYGNKYGEELMRKGMAAWYAQCVVNARKYPKAQEYHNQTKDLFSLAMTPADPDKFVPIFNLYNCSKVSDGASGLMLFTEEGLKKFGIDKRDAAEIIGIGEAEGDLTQAPADLTALDITAIAAKKALASAGITLSEVGKLEIHDCFAITALLSLEAIGVAPPGGAAQMIIDGGISPTGTLPTNLSGGLTAFGHPTGATGVRQLVDLLAQLTGKAENYVPSTKPYAMMISMGGNDKTVTSLILKAAS
jgi:acetyl-CoA C-acetyltransferase